MDSKTVAIIAVFAALAVALNLSPFKFPAPYAPFLFYQIWEIPIVAAFLLFGPSIAVAIAIVNTAALLVLFQGALPTGPVYNLIAVLGTLLGIYGAHWLRMRLPAKQKEAMLGILSTALGGILRVAIMSVVNWTFLRYPPPVGFSMPEAAITAMLPLVGFFNATIVLYTIPAGYVLARAVASGIKAGMWDPAANG